MRNGFGAEGSPIFCGFGTQLFHSSITSARSGLRSNWTNAAAMWPSEAGTRMHCAVMIGSFAFSILPPTSEPQIFIGSCSDFSSSPLMKGMRLSTMSGQLSKVFPAPEIAW